MKTTKLFLALLILGCISFSALEAMPGKAQTSSNNQLNSEIYSVLKMVPYIEILDGNVSLINIEFKVNENHEMTDLKITGENDRLVRYAYWTLSRKVIKVDPELKPSAYSIDVTFIVKE
jgi:hypothetical protein